MRLCTVHMQYLIFLNKMNENSDLMDKIFLCKTCVKFEILTLNLLSLKNKYEDKSENLCLFKFGVQKLTNIIENHVHIRSTNHFKQVGVHGKMTNEINSVDDRCV